MLCSFQAFALFLVQPESWIAGIDFPFGQPRQLIDDLKWPRTWAEYVCRITDYSKTQYARLIGDYRARQPAGKKEHFRVVDRQARSLSPMKMHYTPVGKMFHQGSPFLLASPCQIVPFMDEARPTVVVEAYPGLVARKLIGRRSYKNDIPVKQSTDHIEARKVLVAGITSEPTQKGTKSVLDWYCFRVKMASGLAKQCIDDPSGDKLDAVLAAIQAAWAYSRRHHNYGVPKTCDLLEGWIPDPEIHAT